MSAIIYRYTDLSDNTIKYIGIITSTSKKRCLEERLREHAKVDEWSIGNFCVDFFVVSNKTDAEAYEAHLISLYKTYNCFNKAKANWGVSDFLPNPKWTHYVTYNGKFQMDINRKIIENDARHIHEKEIQRKNYNIWYSEARQAWSVYVFDRLKRRRVSRKDKNELINYLSKYYPNHIIEFV